MSMTDEQVDLALAAELFGLREAITNGPFVSGYTKHGHLEYTRPTRTWLGMELVAAMMRERGWWLALQTPMDPLRTANSTSADVLFRHTARFTKHGLINCEPMGVGNAATAPRAVAEAALDALREGAA